MGMKGETGIDGTPGRTGPPGKNVSLLLGAECRLIHSLKQVQLCALPSYVNVCVVCM